MERYKITKNFLIEEYSKKNKSANEISRDLNISDDTILERIRKYNIPKHRFNLKEKNGMWKGNNVGYTALHEWIKKYKPKPCFCENCQIELSYDLANISGKYKRDLSDWEWLCRKCHMRKDGRLDKFLEHSQFKKRKIKGNLYQCNKCKRFKSKDLFMKDKYTADGLNHLCKACMKDNYQKNRKKIRQYQNNYYAIHYGKSK